MPGATGLLTSAPRYLQFEQALIGMYDFAAADKVLSDKLSVLAVRGQAPEAQSRDARAHAPREGCLCDAPRLDRVGAASAASRARLR